MKAEKNSILTRKHPTLFAEKVKIEYPAGHHNLVDTFFTLASKKDAQIKMLNGSGVMNIEYFNEDDYLRGLAIGAKNISIQICPIFGYRIGKKDLMNLPFEMDTLDPLSIDLLTTMYIQIFANIDQYKYPDISFESAKKIDGNFVLDSTGGNDITKGIVDITSAYIQRIINEG